MSERLCAPDPGGVLLDERIDGVDVRIDDSGDHAKITIVSPHVGGVSLRPSVAEATAIRDSMNVFLSSYYARAAVAHERALACACKPTP